MVTPLSRAVRTAGSNRSKSPCAIKQAHAANPFDLWSSQLSLDGADASIAPFSLTRCLERSVSVIPDVPSPTRIL